jgi:hypothetical protein
MPGKSDSVVEKNAMKGKMKVMHISQVIGANDRSVLEEAP